MPDNHVETIQVSSGQGPEECQLFVYKLQDKISKEAKKQRLNACILYIEPGAYEDIWQSCLMEISGEMLVCKNFIAELEGTHKWIMKSPYKKNHKRKNWFISVKKLQINQSPLNQQFSKKDICFQYFHSSGAGGQNVNKCQTGVRVKHLQSGVSVQSQEERSQILNKKNALNKLIKILIVRNEALEHDCKKEQWNNHQNFERGNPVKIYKGINLDL
ncbi:MAG TPA: peptide chain release factor H, partial [Vampirovibrionales bacterium]